MLGPFRCDDTVVAQIKRRAEAAGETMTDYLIRRALEPDQPRDARELATALEEIGKLGVEISMKAVRTLGESERKTRKRSTK